MNFFSFNFPLREYFFCTSPAPSPRSFLMVRPLEFPHHQPLKFFHSCHMHSPQKHLENNISSITIICGMTYSKKLSQSLRCHRHFFHSSFYSSFSFSWEKDNVIFLDCNRNTRLNKIEANDSNCTGIYCIFISWLVWFPLWVHRKNENWRQIFIFHFSEKNKIWHRFSFLFFYVQKKIKIEHRFSFVIFHFSISKKIKIEHRFPFFIFFMFREKWKLKINCRFLFFIFNEKKKKENWTQIFIFHFSTCRRNEWPEYTRIFTDLVHLKCSLYLCLTIIYV